MRRAAVAAAVLLLGASPQSSPIRGMKQPALSPDGRRIAFSWHGDLWVCPVEGGVAERLTSESADEQKPAWSPDGKRIAFSSDAAGNRDIVILDLSTMKRSSLTVHSADDDAPAWSPDGRWVAFQSNRDSNLDLCLNSNVFDVWRVPAGGGTATRVTRFRGENPAWSPDGKWIAYDRYSSGYSDGEHNLFLIAPDGSGLPREIASGQEDSRRPAFKGGTVYFAHEANGIRFADRRNVWRTSVEGGGLVQVTGHSGDHVTWPTTCEATNTLIYEYDFELYSIDVKAARAHPKRLDIRCADREAYPDTEAVKTFTGGFASAAWSPRGDRIAFVCKGDVWTVAADGGDALRVSEGDEDDRDVSWTSDGKSLVYVSGPWGMPGHILRRGASGGPPERLTPEESHYRTPRLSPKGGALLYSRTVDGETDAFVLDLATGKVSEVAGSGDGESSSACFSPDGETVAFLGTRSNRTELRLAGLKLGTVRVLKLDDSAKAGLAWSPDGTRLAYAARERDGDWVIRVCEAADEPRPRDLGPGVSASWSPDSTMLLCETEPRGRERTLTVYDTKSAQKLPLAVRAARPVRRSEEMRAVFLQVWGSYYNHYYDPYFHGLDLVALRRKYEALAGESRTRPELYELVNDMIREFRSSHIHLKPAPVKNTVATGSLGADVVRKGDGTLSLTRIEPNGPAARAGIREGEILVEAAETKLGPGADLDALLTGEAVPQVTIVVRDAGGEERQVSVKGLDRSALRLLKYDNRTEERKKAVKESSGGRLAYFHIRSMTQPEVTRLKEAIEKEFQGAAGLVFDERDGVGGMAHRPVCQLLDSTSSERLNRFPACSTRNRSGTTTPDRFSGGEGRRSGKSWDKPVIMVQNEISRSDKEILPYTFRHLGIGYLVGMPTAGGVIGGNEWTMQDGSKIVVSVQGWFTVEGRNMEGWGVPPDYRVPETHEDLYAGRDAPLEKAVEVLLAQMDGTLAPPKKPGLEKKVEGSGK